MTRSGASASRSIVQRAEALLRSLVGIAQAEVRIRPTGGVELVRVVADGGLSNGQIVQNVRSALLATFGVLLQPAQIEFVPTAAWAPASIVPPVDSAPAAAPLANPGTASVIAGQAHAPSPPAAAARQGPATAGAESAHGRPTPRPANGNGHAANGHAANGHTARPGEGARPSSRLREPARPAAHQPLPRSGRPAAAPEPTPAVPAPATVDAACAEVAIGNRSVRLERAEIVRQTGRVRCRIVLAAGTDRFSAVADCRDEPLAEAQLAARVTCDALRAGELTATHFEGATFAQLAGLVHVVVSLNGWKAGAPLRRSGSAVVKESVEQAAALAVLHALANT